MTKNHLDLSKITNEIKQHPEFLGSFPTQDVREIPVSERRQHLQNAVATGALSIAKKLETEKGPYDLDANLYALVGNLNSFYESVKQLENLTKDYGSPRQMPLDKRRSFYESKQDVIEFNHTLHEVINSGASKFGFNDLLVFMTNAHTASAGPETTKDFYDKARDRLIGMRNEMAFEQVLIYSGIEYELGDTVQDATGGDFVIEGRPIDVKASEMSAKSAREKAARHGYDPSGIIWSHIDFDDYQGQLTLPYERVPDIAAKVKPELDKILHT